MTQAMLATLDETRLVTEAIAGSPQAFERLVQCHRKRALSLALAVTHDVDDAHDVTQEAFIRAFVRLPEFGTGRPFGAWLSVVVRNVALDSVRRKNVRRKYLPATTASSPGPEDAIVRSEAASRMRDAMRTLPLRQRHAIELYYYRGLTYREIGEELVVPIGTVKTLLHRGLRKMRNESDLA